MGVPVFVMTALLKLALVFLFSVACYAQTYAHTATYTVGANQVKVDWTVNAATVDMRVTKMGSNTGWIGIGFNPAANCQSTCMGNSDFIVGVLATPAVNQLHNGANSNQQPTTPNDQGATGTSITA